jgi:hypothetical protein
LRRERRSRPELNVDLGAVGAEPRDVQRLKASKQSERKIKLGAI